MYLVQLLLPLYDNKGRRFPQAKLNRVEDLLSRRFGGITMYKRAPAEGLYRRGGGGMKHDEIIVFEVMTDELDRSWWGKYRTRLEQRFRQDYVVIRTSKIELM